MEDIRKAFNNGEEFWLNLSILLYVALLPFNAFDIHILPGPYFRLNFSKAALLLVVVFGLWSYFQGRLEIKKAYLLYFFLILQVFANFFSILNSPNPRESVFLAITASQYSILVFILINVIRSEVLLRAILRVMTVVVLVVVVHSLGIYWWRSGVFSTRTQPSILGNGIGHYLSYCLLMFGTGLVYSLFTEESKRFKNLLWVFVGLWIFIVHITAMKAASIVLLVFVSLLLVTFQKERKKVWALITLTILLFIAAFSVVPAMSAYLTITRLEDPVVDPVVDPVAIPRDLGDLFQVLLHGNSPVKLTNSVYGRWVGQGNSLKVRIRGWLSGLMMGWSSPLSGVGVGQTGHYITSYSELAKERTKNTLLSLPGRDRFFSNEHFYFNAVSVYNIFINAWAETGIFGLIAIIGIIFSVIIKGVPVFVGAGKSGNVNALCCFLPLFLSILLYHQVIYFWFHPWLWTIVALTYTAADLSRFASRGSVN